MKFVQAYNGKWIQPRMTDWRMKCCRCRLVHTVQFRIVKIGKRQQVQLRAWRHPRRKKKLA